MICKLLRAFFFSHNEDEEVFRKWGSWSSLVEEINLDGKEMWETVGLGHPVVTVTMVFTRSVGLGISQILLEDVVEPELVLFNAGDTTVVGLCIDGVGFDLTGWADGAAFIGVDRRSGGDEGSKGSEEFHLSIKYIINSLI